MKAKLVALVYPALLFMLLVAGAVISLVVIKQVIFDSPVADAICGAIQSGANATPTQTPTPVFTPVACLTPTPLPDRWCNSTGCYWGEMPTEGLDRWCNSTGCYWGEMPTPDPYGGSQPCEARFIPAELRWQVYNPCYCRIRSTYGLGPYFSVAEACNEIPRRQWATESCECLRLLVEGG